MVLTKVFSGFKFGTHSHLVISTTNNLRKCSEYSGVRSKRSFRTTTFSLNVLLHTHKRAKAGACQGHGKGCHGNGVEVQDSWIDFQWRKSLVRGKARQHIKSYVKLLHRIKTGTRLPYTGLHKVVQVRYWLVLVLYSTLVNPIHNKKKKFSIIYC